MGIGVRYDDGSGSMRQLADYKKPLASYRGMSSPWGSNGHSLFGTPSAKSMNGPALRRKSLMEKLREKRDIKKIKLDEIDPRGAGGVLGVAAAPHPIDADKGMRSSNGHDPWGRSYMTGLHFEREAPTGRIIVWGYLRTDRFTGEGRCFETTGEEKVPVFSFFADGQSSDSGPFAIEYNDGGEKIAIGKGGFYRARTFVGTPRTEISGLDSFTGRIWLRVSAGTGTGQIAYGNVQFPESDETYTIFPLYEMEDGEVVTDYRGCPHWQVYE